jgi:cobalt-zinc-cadmium efflux system protein
MGHNHGHNHNHGANHNLPFAIGIGLNIAFVIIELFYGFIANSSALIADAGHNASDVLGLIFAWFAIWLSKQKTNSTYTYGYKKSTILVSLLNSILLFIAIAYIINDAITKFQNPLPVAGNQIMIIAGIGFIINGITAFLFMRGQKSDLNVRGAFLHLAADAVVSLGVVIGGLLIQYTGYNWIDPILSFIIAAVIIMGTWSLFHKSLKLILDASPNDIDINKVRESILKNEGVSELHDLHIWALSTNENALSVHIKTNKSAGNQLLSDINHLLISEFNLKHITIQIENNAYDCGCNQNCYN